MNAACRRREQSRTIPGASGAILLMVLVAIPVQAQTLDENTTSLINAAATLSKEGDFDGATNLYLKAYDRSKEPALLYNAARVQDKKGDLGRAKELYERYLRTEKDPEGIKRGQERLSDLLDRIPGRLVVTTSPPGAALEVDGRRVTGPVELRRGTHEVTATLDGYAPARAVAEILSGEESRLALTLTPLPGSLVVDCGVGGARVTANGIPVGRTPLSGPVALTPGRYVVGIEAPGYEPFVKTVDVSAGRPVPVLARLVPLRTEKPASDLPARVEQPTRTVFIPVSLALSEGFLRYAGATKRTHLGLEADLTLRFAGASWLAPGLGLSTTLESPVAVTLRPGIRWYLGSPVFLRTAAAILVTPVRQAGVLFGAGWDVALWKGGLLRLEATTCFWSPKIFPLEFAVGLGHAF